MTVKSLCLPLGAALCSVSGAASAETDSLSPERLASIKAAFDQTLQDPAAHPDRLSPARLAVMQLAYDTDRPATRVDDLTHDRWTAVLAAYRTHDPEVQGVTLAGGF